MVLVDANIPLRIAQRAHAQRQIALDAIKLLASRDGEEFVIVPQVLYEMYVVCTRPRSQNGLEMTSEEGRGEVASVRSLFHLLDETAQVYSR